MLLTFLTLFFTLGVMYFLLSSRNLGVKVLYLDFTVFLAILFYSGVMGIRYGEGTDYFSYLYIYENALMTGSASLSFITEPAFYFLITFLVSFKAHYTLFFVVIAFIQIYFLALAFKENKHILKYIIVAFFALQLISWMNGLRQITSVAIFIYAINSIKDGNWVKYYLLAILAAAFHNSAVLLFVAYPVFRFSWHKMQWSVIVQISLLLLSAVFSLGSLIEGLIFSKLGPLLSFLEYDGYVNYSSVKEGGRGIGFLIVTLINIIIIFYGNKAKDFFKDSSFSIFYALSFFGVIWTNVVFPSIILDRPNYFMQGMNFVVVGHMLYYLRSNLKGNLINQVGFYLLLLLTIFMMSAVALSVNPDMFRHFINQM